MNASWKPHEKFQQATGFDEIAANTFDAEPLMPSYRVKREYGRLIGERRLTASDDIAGEPAGVFKAGATAMSIKLQNPGFRFAIA